FILAGVRHRRPAAPPPRPKEPRPQENVPEPDPFVFGSATEKRNSVRRSYPSVEVLIRDAEAAGEPEAAWVLDRSMGGLCLRVDGREIAVGTILSVRARNAPKGVPWTPVEVKRCRKIGKSWELGCRFISTLSWSVLLLFG